MTRNILIIVLVIAAAVAVSSLSRTAEQEPPEQQEASKPSEGTIYEEYDSPAGVRFEYRTSPDGYTLVKRSGASLGEEFISRSYILMNTEGYAEVLESGIPTEGPPMISITIFPNPENIPSRAWAEQFPRFSLLELALSPVTETSVGGKAAVTYTADGLYPSDMYIVVNDSQTYVISGGYMTPEDRIRKDFRAFLESVEFF